MHDTRASDAEACRGWQASRHGYVPRSWWLDPSWVAVRLARRSWTFHRRGNGLVARFLMQLNAVLTGADVEPDSEAGPGLLVPNPLGVSIWIHAGRDLTMHPLSGSGNTMREGELTDAPTAGDGVEMGPFTGAQGPIRLGDGVRVLPGAAALKSFAPGQWVDCKRASRILTASEDPGSAAEPADTVPPSACPHASLRKTFSDWRRDVRRLQDEASRVSEEPVRLRFLSSALLNQNIALLVYRLSHFFHVRRLSPVAALLAAVNRWIFKLTIPPNACLGPGVWLPHLAGTIVQARSGANLTGFAQTCISPREGPFGVITAAPVIGEGVLVAGHGGILGAVRVGDHAQVSRKANIGQDLGPGVTAVAEASICGPVTAPELPVRELAADPLPSYGALRRSDRDARRRYQATHGQLPLQSRLAVLLFRRSQRAHGAGRLRSARGWWLLSRYLTGADIAPRSRIGPGLVIVCAPGTNFDGAAGSNLTLIGQCFVGGLMTEARTVPGTASTPLLGGSITVPPHTTIYGGCTLGNNVAIDPGVTIRKDIPNGARVVPPGLRLLTQNKDA